VTNGLYFINSVNDRFFIGGSNGSVLTSTDGVNWTAQTYENPLSYIRAFAYGNDKYIGAQSKKILSSIDGTTWTVEDTTIALYFIQMLYCNNEFVALIHRDFDRNDLIGTSPDGIAWTVHNLGTTDIIINSITYGDSQFVAVGNGSSILASRADKSAIIAPKRAIQGGSGRLVIKRLNNRIICTVPSRDSRMNYRVELYTLAGRRCYSAIVRANDGMLTIPMDKLTAGTYFLTVMNKNNWSLSAKIVLKK
jgi:hypothetical protein